MEMSWRKQASAPLTSHFATAWTARWYVLCARRVDSPRGKAAMGIPMRMTKYRRARGYAVPHGVIPMT